MAPRTTARAIPRLLRFRLNHVLDVAFLGSYLFAALFPIYWIFVSSFKTPLDTLAIPPAWLFRPTLGAYQNIFVLDDYAWYFLNTVVIAIGTTVIALAFGSLAAYALDRYPFRFRNVIAYALLGTRFLFPIIYAIPLFQLFNRVGLLDTRTGLIIAYTTFSLPYAVWIMQSFFGGIPTDLDDAARIDGCSRLGAFWRVILPISAPGLGAAAIFIMLLAWNEFLFALILAGGGTARTLPVAASMLVGQRQIEWNELCALATATIVPLLVFFGFLQKHLIRGMVAGAVKG
ncbi:MAG: carbohydrate ABC transporter permease [candidate division NC10 bacterium]|nr:carbohydrate ABC transporter permease [candidate division NC10 bacterium]MBI2563689.1 carbohydrate ABC transporter permease [candidate division NC10 bacterium]MBI3085014.1 carbohydrate ABC transporter permease [candidate division NC10 bacterium]